MVSSSIIREFSSFYRISDPFSSYAIRLKLSQKGIWAQNGTIAYQVLVNKYKYDSFPLAFTRHSGKDCTDVLWSTMVHLFCTSSRLNQLLGQNKISGWTTYPVEVDFDLDDCEIFGFSITGPELSYAPEYSETIRKAIPGRSVYRTMQKGLFFDKSDWDGSDFFLVSGFVVGTQKVYELFKQATVRNVLFTPLSEVEINPVVAQRLLSQ